MHSYENYQKTKVIQQGDWYVVWIGHATAVGYIGANLWRKGTGIKLFLKDGRY